MEKVTGPAGIECYRITDPSGAEATFALHGGHLISWKTADGIERLFLSDQATFGPGSAIRGGVPIIFPQFSDHGPFGRHGFARKSEWTIAEDGESLSLTASPETLEKWPHAFELCLSAELNESGIAISLSVKNPGDTPIEFHAALHTYLIADLESGTTVQGLSGRDFLNEVTGETETDVEPQIVFGKEVDRAYLGTGEESLIIEENENKIEISSSHFPDTVIWNPGPDHGISDLPTEGWKQFICVEGAFTRDYKQLPPHASWQGTQRIKILSGP